MASIGVSAAHDVSHSLILHLCSCTGLVLKLIESSYSLSNRCLSSNWSSELIQDEGNAVESNMCPQPFIDWNKTYEICWKLSKGSNANDRCPRDPKDFLLALYEQDNSPLQDPNQRVGITFSGFYDALMSTPAVFEGTDVDTTGPWALTADETPGESLPRDPNPESIEWEAYRISKGNC
eukprot:COSAG05_NODE_412_length_10089_cov_13.887287_7_plen_179_part_00